MSLAIVTGSSGLVGSETVKFLIDKNYTVIGIDNDSRKYFFGTSTNEVKDILIKEFKQFTHHNVDIRDYESLKNLFQQLRNDIKLIVHSAAQPSHDWAIKEPLTDFTINANGTLNLLELTRQYCSTATFIQISTNKVYGDTPNRLPLEELITRYEINNNSNYFKGIDENMSIDNSTHSLFGVSKCAGDLLAQEYGKNLGLNVGIFRGGCITGPNHAGAELHGFLNYLVKANIEEIKYTIYGYKGKQVRDNIHSYDLANCFWHFHKNPKKGEVYNMGGGRNNSCSILEAISIIEEITNKKMKFTIADTPRVGDHQWYISDVSKFKKDYPKWDFKYSLRETIEQIIERYKR